MRTAEHVPITSPSYVQHADIVIRSLRYEAQAARQFRLEGHHDEADGIRDGDQKKTEAARSERATLLARIAACAEVAADLKPVTTEGLGHMASLALVALDQVPGPVAQRLVRAVLDHIRARDPWD
ncbi:hypothetical protein [Salinarimonas soli]|uniref:Uncharacterized protein n=1 Tax=Salinarimonas soli TaxID=1638099 RepID=A0A5B2VE93_9HYPH|nr:hypothetical protein [Salinarimonas soli]KAA2236968.1 hypothetical protein F0L46_11895 [Salinarimonas soli]